MYEDNGYIKTWKWDINGDFIPLTKGGSSSSYLYDYCYYKNNGWKVLFSGGSAINGASAGLFCFCAYNGASFAYAYFGGRLNFTPSNN
jgi:hypothetical protein